jgi:hypothetical protein
MTERVHGQDCHGLRSLVSGALEYRDLFGVRVESSRARGYRFSDTAFPSLVASEQERI